MTAPRRIEDYDLHGTGSAPCEVYEMPLAREVAPGCHEYWPAVTDVRCPIDGCGQTIVWYEAGYVPGYRVCMASAGEDTYDHSTLRHRFLARGNHAAPTLVRDAETEVIEPETDQGWCDGQGTEDSGIPCDADHHDRSAQDISDHACSECGDYVHGTETRDAGRCVACSKPIIEGSS